MFTANDIRTLLTAKDFRPFAIYTKDGARYEITNHDMVLLSRNSVDIGIGRDSDGIAQQLVRCAIIHVTRIEELEAA